MDGDKPETDTRLGTRATGYEPPRVERVLSADDLDREVIYAGAPKGPSLPPT
jgi:hypothetical protein